MPDTWNIYWGEMHDNMPPYPIVAAGRGFPPIVEALRAAASHLDFYAAAYYTAEAEAFAGEGHLAESDRPHKLVNEHWKAPRRLAAEWADVQAATRAGNRPGAFVTFPGYEWQGDGSSGDHNVIARREGLPIFRVRSLAELYARLRGRDAIAIPHHTAYRPGVRGRDWSVFDERLSPVTEIFSIHGCSETDEEWVGMRHNSHLGPAIGAGTYQAALDRGLHLGAICSNDNWGKMPGTFGRGLAACLAAELTRPALWDAFLKRRMYGVTGDRIRLDFTVNDAPMGSIVKADRPRRIRVAVVGADAIDRIEILRGARVIATHCHQGTWELPRPGRPARFKLRVEAGWGPRPNELAAADRKWAGELAVAGGRVLGWEPCWISPGQGRARLRGGRAAFTFLTSTAQVGERWQNADVLEFRADPAARLSLRLNGLEAAGPVLDFARESRELWFRDECTAALRKTAGIVPSALERADLYHHVAFKAKLHRAVPEAAYTAALDIEDDEPCQGETHYRVRVEQRNGQRAWSSPIWVKPRRPRGRR